MNNKLVRKLSIQIIIIVAIIATVFTLLVNMQTQELKNRIFDKANLFSTILGAHLDNIIGDNLRAYQTLQKNVEALVNNNEGIEDVNIINLEKVIIASGSDQKIGSVPDAPYLTIIDDVIQTKRQRAIVKSILGRELVIHFMPLFASQSDNHELIGIMQMMAKFPSKKGELVTALRKNRNVYYKEEALRFATTLSKSLELVLGEVQRYSAYIDDLIVNMLKDKEIQDIKIYTKDLQFLISAQGRGRESLDIQQKTLYEQVMNSEKITISRVGQGSYLTEIISPLYITRDDQKKSLGAVGIVISSKQILELVSARRNSIILMSIIIICAFILIIGLFFKLSVIGPIGDLTQMAQNIAKGDFSKKSNVSSDDEIGYLAQSFNHMSDQLVNSKNEIEQWNKKLQDKIKQVTDDLNAKQDMLIKTEKMASLGVLSAGIAHEINNPLGVILGHAQMLLRQFKQEKYLADPQEAVKLLQTIENYTKRCSYIVNSLVEFSRQKQMKMIPVSVNQAVENALVFTKSRIDNKNIEVIKNLADNLPEILADQIHLEQVFINIIINAQASMTDGGKLEITSQQFEDKLQISFKDTGQGIARKNIDRIFEPFFSTKETGEGSGLGLSLSYGIIHAHDGEIRVQSQAGVGTTLDVILPIKS